MGRIIHDYGYHPRDSYSVNSTHSSTSVKYTTFKERMHLLGDIRWFIKADMATGFRQFGTHPKDWPFQVYCNGPNEHYIDLSCPYGKTNSPLEFCPPVALFAKSAAYRYARREQCSPSSLGTHVDDIFGGFPSNDSYTRALHFR